MSDAAYVNDHDSDHAVQGLPLFECCCCYSSKYDPVKLKCFHYYCRSCFDASFSSAQGFNSTVTCPACSVVTEISTVQINSFLSTCKRATAIRAELVWCNACEKNGKEETAEFWCVVCAEALCGACFGRHNRFSDGHRIFELEHARSLPLRQLTEAVRCSIHMLAMEANCVTCCLPKCAECLDSCRADSHDLNLLSDPATDEHISSVTKIVSDAAERLGAILPGTLQKCRAIANRLQSGRSSGHRMLVEHRRSLHHSTVSAFDVSASDVCCHLQSIHFDRPAILAKGIPRKCAANIETLALSGVRRLQLLAVRFLLKTVAHDCCLPLRSSINRRLQRFFEESGSISISGSVSSTSDIVLRACLGTTVCRQAALPAPLLFRKASVSFETPISCCNLAATRDGRMLLAAAERGLLVYSDRGQQLCSWKPARRSNGEDDRVNCVAALDDGRAAVGLGYARLVLLLKRSDIGDSWQEDHRVTVLHSPPSRLAALGDLLVVAEFRFAKPQIRLHYYNGRVTLGRVLFALGPVVNLLRLSSGQVLYRQKRDCDIDSVALTALCVFTTSRDTVKRSNETTPCVLEAFSHSGQFLWRYETSKKDIITCLCASADSWSRVYVAVTKLDGSRTRIKAFRGFDGRDCREVMSSLTHGLQLPMGLALARGQQHTVLAVLNYERSAKQARGVSLYEATDE